MAVEHTHIRIIKYNLLMDGNMHNATISQNINLHSEQTCLVNLIIHFWNDKKDIGECLIYNSIWNINEQWNPQ